MIDLKKLKEIYRISRDLNLEDIQVLLNSAGSISFAKGEHLIKEGTKKNKIFYLKKGLVRSFIINEQGEEITVALLPEHHIVASADLILFNQPSRFFFEALEETSTFFMDYEVMQNIISKNARLEQNRKYFLQKMLKNAHERIESFVLYSPEERYEKFIVTNPDLVNRVPDKYIANVLGITPVSLSRIRKRIITKKK